MKLKTNLLIIFLLSSWFLVAQQSKRDSLKEVVKTHVEDTNKVNALRLLAVDYMNANPDSAIIIANQCLSLASKLSVSQNKSISNVGKKIAARVTGNIGSCYERKSEFDRALEYDNKALKMAEKIGDKLIQANNLGNIGIIYFKQGNYSKSLEFDQKALKIAKEIDNNKLITDNLNSIATIFYLQSNYPKALTYYFEALKIDEEIGNKKGVEMRLGNIGNVYYVQRDFDKAINHYNKALKISVELGDVYLQATNLGNIGVVYYELSDYETALEYYFKSLKIAEETENIPLQSNNLSNIANIYKVKSNHQKALEFYLAALKLDEQISDKQGVSVHLGKIGSLYASLRKYKKAEEYLTKALALSTELNILNLMKEHEKLLAEFYEETNRKDLAYIHFKKYIALRDSIFNEENTKLLIRTEMDHEFEKKQAVADAEHKSEMAKQAAVSEEKQRRQSVVIWSVGIGLLLVFVFAVFVLRSLRITNKQKQLIEIKNRETHEQKVLIEEKAAELAVRHKEITDSINYAERIQRSFLATKELLDANLKEYFVFFKPKDVVSGDFYWASSLRSFENLRAQSASRDNKKFALVTADSTGHGVPGAIMSILNISSLEKAVEQGLEDPADIFNHTRKTIIERLKKDGSVEGGKDGMDASITVYDFVNKKLFVTAAHNPVWIMRKNEIGATEIFEIKPEKMPVGKHDLQDVSFTTREVNLQSGDVIYTLTDGFSDQFGGENGKKFMSKNLRELLAANTHLPMQQQKEILEKIFLDWIGGNEQVDDVTVIGVKV